MKNEPLDINNIVAGASYLSDAISGLDSFIYHNLSDNMDVSLKDLDMLAGLVKAIQTLADKHAKETDEFSTSGGAAVEK